MEAIRKLVHFGSQFFDLRGDIIESLLALFGGLTVLTKECHLNRKDRQSLVKVIVEFAGDSASLIFLRVNQPAT